MTKTKISDLSRADGVVNLARKNQAVKIQSVFNNSAKRMIIQPPLDGEG
jgi:hypothetical protein